MRACWILFVLIAWGAHAQRSTTSETTLNKGHVDSARLVQVHGTVTDSLTGKPVYASLVEHYDLSGKRWAVTTVNSDGRYAIFVPTGLPFEIRVTKENGYVDLHHRAAAIPAGTEQFELDLVLRPK